MIHLKEALEEHYTVAVDWEGTLFCGVKLTWDYINRHVETHMPGYIPKALRACCRSNKTTKARRYSNLRKCYLLPGT
jgi:hypothetical protein